MPAPSVLRSYINSGNASTRTVSSVNATGGDLLLIKVCSAYSDGSQVPTAVTFNGSATGITVHATRSDGSTLPYLRVYYLVAPTQTTANVVVTFNAGTHAVVVVEVWVDANQTTPCGTAQSASAQGGTAVDLTCTTGTASDTITDFAGLHKALDGTATLAVASGQTPTQNGTSGASSTLAAVGAGAYIAGGTSVPVNYTASASSRWAIIAFPVQAAAAGGGGRLVGGSLVQEWFTRGLLAG